MAAIYSASHLMGIRITLFILLVFIAIGIVWNPTTCNLPLLDNNPSIEIIPSDWPTIDDYSLRWQWVALSVVALNIVAIFLYILIICCSRPETVSIIGEQVYAVMAGVSLLFVVGAEGYFASFAWYNTTDDGSLPGPQCVGYGWATASLLAGVSTMICFIEACFLTNA